MARDKAKDTGIPAVDLAVVQEALILARSEHPNDVLVLKGSLKNSGFYILASQKKLILKNRQFYYVESIGSSDWNDNNHVTESFFIVVYAR